MNYKQLTGIQEFSLQYAHIIKHQSSYELNKLLEAAASEGLQEKHLHQYSLKQGYNKKC